MKATSPTSEYIYDKTDELVEWAEKRIFGFKSRPDAHAIGHMINGKLAAVVVFDTFSENDCIMTIGSNGSRKWMTREYIRRVMVYPFVQLKLSRITCLVSAYNAPSLRLCRHFGWVEEGRRREDGPDGEDMILFGMLHREATHWLVGATSKSAANKV